MTSSPLNADVSEVQAPARLSQTVTAPSVAPSTLTATNLGGPQSIEEVLIALQSDTGVSSRTFDKFFLRCWKCAKVVKLPHSCVMPFIDLTLDDGEEDGFVDTSEPDTENELVICAK